MLIRALMSSARAKKPGSLGIYDFLQFWPLVTLLPLGGAVAHLLRHPKKWSRGQKVALGVAGAAVAANLIRWQLERHLQEAPEYQVLGRRGPLEVRRYPKLVVAETHVDAGFEDALNEGFARLASYLYGKNVKHESMSMTSPVVAQHEQLSMMAPVTTQPAGQGHTISFVMPSGRTVEDLPRPADIRVSVHELPERTLAVLRFSGRYDAKHVDEAMARFIKDCHERGLTLTSPPAFAGYDAPATLPLLRRNEIWAEIA